MFKPFRPRRFTSFLTPRPIITTTGFTPAARYYGYYPYYGYYYPYPAVSVSFGWGGGWGGYRGGWHGGGGWHMEVAAGMAAVADTVAVAGTTDELSLRNTLFTL